MLEEHIVAVFGPCSESGNLSRGHPKPQDASYYYVVVSVSPSKLELLEPLTPTGFSHLAGQKNWQKALLRL